MAKSRYEYVKAFELDDRILPQTFIVVRIDGRGFSRFTDAHGYIKPNDPRGLALMAQCAAAVMRDWGEAILAFGHSDEFSFVFPPQSTVFGRRAAKVATGIASQFAATFVFYWSRFFDDKALLYPPTFDARCVAYPTIAIASDYLKWRQVDAYINCMYNEAFWALQQKGGMTADQAHVALKGTLAETKHEVLHTHGINFAKLPAAYRRGMTLVRIGRDAPPEWLLGGADVRRPEKQRGAAKSKVAVAKAAAESATGSLPATTGAAAAAAIAGLSTVSTGVADADDSSASAAAVAASGGAGAGGVGEAAATPAAYSTAAPIPDTDPGVSMGAFATLAPSVALCFPDYCRGSFLTRLMEAYAPSHS